MARRKKRFEKRNKRKKSKAKLTSAYKKTEQEVQLMLQKVTNSNISPEIDSETQSADFFCKTLSARSASRILQGDTYDRQEEERIEALAEEERSKSPSEVASLQSENRTAESTYIQIDALEEPIINPVPKVKHVTNMDILLYKPTDQLNPYISLPMNIEVVSKEVVRLLNRYYEETHNVSKELVKALTNDIFHVQDKALYRTFCSKEFSPIFCRAQKQLVQIPVRRLLKLHLNKVHFTDHPELLQEHRFANACERAYVKYAQHKENQICENLNLKLRQERAVMQQMLQQASLDDEQGSEVAKQMLLVRKLREDLHAAELESKLLIQEVIEKWLLLKKIRKSQKQQFSRFKLRVNIKQVEDVTWKKSYKRDLEEIYGEKLEEYYREQRKWKKHKQKAGSDNKPEKPKLKRIARELREKYKHLFGGPIIEMQRCDVGYQNLDTIKQKIRSFYMNIYLDDQFVCSSRNYRMEPDFTCHIDETFGVLLDRHIPKQALLAIHEKSKLPVQSKKLAKIIIPLPNLRTDANNSSNFVQYEFESKHQPICGYLNARLFFTLQEENMQGTHSEHSLTNEEGTVETLKLDELEKQTEAEKGEENLKQLDTCSFEEERLMFCSLDELKANRRFELLFSRQLQNNARTKDLRFIPALEQEIAHEKFNLNDSLENLLDIGNWMETIDLQLHQGKKYIKCLYDAIRDQCARLSKISKNGCSLLEGDEPGNWSAVFEALVNIFRPSRFLSSVLTENKLATQPITSDTYQKFKLVFNVVRATGIPVRNLESDAIEERGTQDNQTYFSTKSTF